jgi:hypothetical protein
MAESIQELQMIKTIYIPSRGRAKKLQTPYTLPKSLRKRCVVVVRKDEVDEYKELHPALNFAVLPKRIEGLSPTRQWILEEAEERWHVQLDDDITAINHKPVSTKFGGLKKVDPSHFVNCFELLEKWLKEGIAHVSFTDRVSAARPSKKDYYENGRIAQTLFYDKRAIKDAGARFDRCALMQDLDMNLQLLGAGFKNRIATVYSYNARAEDAAGVCVLYRTDELKQKVGRQMMKLHPGITEMREKQKYGRTYFYMKTDWKKAFNAGRQ